MSKLEKTCKHIEYCNVGKVRKACRNYETCQTYKFYEKYPQVLLEGYTDLNVPENQKGGVKV